MPTHPPLLHIQDLHVTADGQPILRGLDLTLPPGEVHVLMGKNGQGKSTLAQVLAGAPGYHVTQGSITYRGQDLLALPPETRANLGVFVGFQHPVEIPGVSIITFLKAAMDALSRAREETPMPAPKLLHLVKETMRALGLDPTALTRSLNEGFSGGEKKRLELLQMVVLAPTLSILDEPDSGLDADALRRVGTLLQGWHTPARTTLIITHYTHLFAYMTPDRVHVMHQGRVVQQGDASLAEKIRDQGYDAVGTASPSAP